MAEPSTTTGVKPLTEAEQKTRDELNARAAAAAVAQADADRQAKLAALAPVDALLKLLRTDKIGAALDAVIADPNIDFDTKALVQSYRQSADYNLGKLNDNLTALSTPVVAPTVSA